MQQHLKFLIVLHILFTGAYSLLANGITFSKENIAVSIITPTLIEIRGEYFFTAKDNAHFNSSLYYPFPVDSLSSYPCSISVSPINTDITISFMKSEKGIYFPIEVNPGDTTGILVIYRQKVLNNKASYILTTTSAWGNPLHNSTYSVSVPQSITLNYLSYECDSVLVKGNRVLYTFFKDQFMPDRDLIFSWSER